MRSKLYYNIYVDGGLTISNFIKAQKLESIVITSIPILLGSGIKLFSSFDTSIKLQMLNSKKYLNDTLIQIKYKLLYK